MRTFVASCMSVVLLLTASTARAACVETAPDYTTCLERLVLTQSDALNYHAQRETLLTQRLEIKTEQITILQQDREQLVQALTAAKDAGTAASGWWNSPGLWLGIGLFLGSAVTIGVGVAASQAWRH